jgi:hypothetical protein
VHGPIWLVLSSLSSPTGLLEGGAGPLAAESTAAKLFEMLSQIQTEQARRQDVYGRLEKVEARLGSLVTPSGTFRSYVFALSERAALTATNWCACDSAGATDPCLRPSSAVTASLARTWRQRS